MPGKAEARSDQVRPVRRAEAFTIVELLIIVGIVGVLIAILVPVISKARKASAKTTCLSNLGQLMAAEIAYAGDNQGFLPYCGCGDAPGAPKGGDYRANWLYAPSLASAANGHKGVALSGAFTATDVQSGALYQYLNTSAVYRCPLDTSPPSMNSANKPLFNALTSYTMNIWMSNFNSDPDLNGRKNNHHLHRISEFPSYTRVFWDFPAAGAVGNTKTSELKKADPASGTTAYDHPCISGRHGGPPEVPPTTEGPAILDSMTGGCPMVYLDGHADITPFYDVYIEYNTYGAPKGTSPYWVSPNDAKNPNGGWNGSKVSMKVLYSPN